MQLLMITKFKEISHYEISKLWESDIKSNPLWWLRRSLRRVQGNGLQLYLFIYSVFQDKGVVVASTETEAAEQVRLPVSGLLPVKRPRLQQMLAKEKENRKEANNKEFFCRKPI